jgi:hypothetical protein
MSKMRFLLQDPYPYMYFIKIDKGILSTDYFLTGWDKHIEGNYIFH